MYTCPLFLLGGKFPGGRILDLPQDPQPSQAIGQSNTADRARSCWANNGERRKKYCHKTGGTNPEREKVDDEVSMSSGSG